ncbi:MAG TPA: EscU/YscU/HrcU family type III secretion system export apparatus switch protein [Anaeromyxobacteraceae bacterium]|nr:EscU/YscU/HrcU family type III secretion system export apparatus switch protein [Anaeromyxobacteraceae bacterium]
MAEERDRENQTEPASAQRLRKAWDEGQLAIGHDALLVAGLAGATVALVAMGGALRASVVTLFAETAGTVDRAPFASLSGLAMRPALLAASVCAAAALGSVAAGVAQTRGGFWASRVGPDLTRVFDPARLARPFTREFLVDLLLALAKVGALGAAAWSALEDEVLRLPRLLTAPPAEQLAEGFRILLATAKPVLAVAAVLAGLELAVTRWRFAVKMRMTKEEAKREAKEEEGDPLLRGRRRQRHRELARGQVRAEVPRADAVVVNPTHIAVALRYRKDESRAPRVIAKGKGALAEYIRELARENGIPIVQDVPLARLLYRKVKVGREIPAQTYKAVATILAFVYRMTGRRNHG